jgi:hypothetical protein
VNYRRLIFADVCGNLVPRPAKQRCGLRDKMRSVRRGTTIAILAVLLGFSATERAARGEPKKMPAANSLMVIAPYKHHGMWVFDDPAVGLDKEPFIAGIDTMIDKMTANIPHAERGFRAVFSAQPFPGYLEKLDWRRQESGGNW